MKAGKLSQTIWRRSVQKQLHIDPEVFPLQPSQEETCTAVRKADGQVMLSASASGWGKDAETGFYVILKALNDLAGRGGTPEGISIQLLLSEDREEKHLRETVKCLEETGRKMEVPVAGLQAEVCPVIRQSVVQATVWGTAEEECLRRPADIRAGQEILLCGYVGLEGTLRILDLCGEELGKRFVPAFLRQAKELKTRLIRWNQLPPLSKTATAVQQIGSGGILGTLWEIAEASGIGLELDLAKMNICQETVEVCEYYHLNPYQMTSAGSMLLVTDQGEILRNRLEGAGICVSSLGVTTAENARIIRNGEEQRFLERPAPDELARWQAERNQERV